MYLLFRLNLNYGEKVRIKKAEEEFRDFLKKGKHRVTPERFEVMDFALDYDGHFGADELYIKMKTEKSNISRATIYNTLELLASCELLAKRKGPSLWRLDILGVQWIASIKKPDHLEIR